MEQAVVPLICEKFFCDDDAAFEYLDALAWSAGVICPHCNVVGGRVYKLKGVRNKPSKRNPLGAVRHGLRKCGECRKQFTGKIGTVFEDAKLPFHKVLQAIYLLKSGREGVSTEQLTQILDIQYNSAWFLSQRIHHALDPFVQRAKAEIFPSVAVIRGAAKTDDRRLIFSLDSGDVTLTFPKGLTKKDYDRLGDQLNSFLKQRKVRFVHWHVDEKKSQLDKFKDASRKLEADDNKSRFDEIVKRALTPVSTM